MNSRKIIKFGNSSFVITLPNEWVKTNKLEKGNDLNLTQTNNSLIVSIQDKTLTDKTKTIDIDKIPLKIFNKKLISYYLKNYKFIKIQGEKVIEKLEEIRIFKEKLSSVEIFEIGKDYILLKDLNNPEKLNTDDLTNKIIDMLKILFDEIIDEKRFNFIKQLDSNVNKLTFLGYKSINYNLENKLSVDENKNAIYKWRIISSLEEIGDILKRVARYIRNTNEENDHNIGLLLLSLKKYYEFITSLLHKDINLENNLKVYLDKKQSLLKEIENSREKFDKNIDLYLVVTQQLKDIIGDLDTITLSVIDIYSE